MSESLLQLHKMAAEASVLQRKLIAGVISQEEYNNKIQSLSNHEDIILENEHQVRDSHYREILNGALKISKLDI